MKLRLTVIPLVLGLVIVLGPLDALGRSEGAIQKTWDYPEGVIHLVIDADRQEVVLKLGGPRLTGRLVGDTGDVLKTSQNGDTVNITVRTDRSWFSWQKKTSRIEVSLPAGLDIDVSTASGSIIVDVPTNGLRARAASGEVRALKGGAGADVDAASGNVRLKGFTGTVRANSFSGNVILDEVSGDIRASAMSGNVDARDVSPAAGSRFTTVSGNVELELKDGPGAHEVRGETVSGNITIGDVSGQGKVVAGTGPSVLAQTVSGNVSVR